MHLLWLFIHWVKHLLNFPTVNCSVGTMKPTARGQVWDENLCISNERSGVAKDPGPRLMVSRKQLIIIVMTLGERRGGDHRGWPGQTKHGAQDLGGEAEEILIYYKTVRIWKFDRWWRTDQNPAGLTSFFRLSVSDLPVYVTCSQGHYDNIVTPSVDVVHWFILASGQPLAAPAPQAPSVKSYHGTGSTLPSFPAPNDWGWECWRCTPSGQ